MKYFKKLFTFLIRNKIFVLIFLCAFLLRFIGAVPGFNQYHSDEGMSYAQATAMIKEGTLNPTGGYSLNYAYGNLTPLILYIFFNYLFVPLGWILYLIKHIPDIIDGIIHFPISPLEQKRIMQLFIFGERDINTIFWGRYITALFSFGNVVLLYYVVKKLFKSPLLAILSSLFLAFNFRHVTNSHVSLPDIYNSFFLLLSLLTSIQIINNPTKKDYLLAGVTAALSFSIKFQVFGILCFGVAHLINIFKRRNFNIYGLFSKRIFIGFFSIPLILLIINPFHFIHYEDVISQLSYVYLKYGAGSYKLNIYPLWYLFNFDFGPPLAFLSLTGVFIGIKKYKLQMAFLLPLVFLHFFIFMFYTAGGFYIRNFIVITPILLVFSAISLEFLNDKFSLHKSRYLKVVYLLVIWGVIFIPARNSLINSYFYTKPWNYEVIKKWEKKNLPDNSVVAAHPFDPLDARGVTRKEFTIAGSYSLAEHKDDEAQYALMNLDWGSDQFYYWMHCGLEDLKSLCRKPYDDMKNSFAGLVAEEMVRYQVYSISKPWQASDANLILSKIPVWSENNLKKIHSYTFDNSSEGWSYIDDDRNTWINNIENKSGSLLYQSKVRNSIPIRLSSPKVDIKPGHLYKIAGFVKSESALLPEEREGYLRVDFYDNDDFKKAGILSSISARYFGDTWKKLETIERAPDKAKFMIISFQSYNAVSKKMYIDNIEIEESPEVIEDITKRAPYINRPIDIDSIYPNSHGNL